MLAGELQTWGTRFLIRHSSLYGLGSLRNRTIFIYTLAHIEIMNKKAVITTKSLKDFLSLFVLMGSLRI